MFNIIKNKKMVLVIASILSIYTTQLYAQSALKVIMLARCQQDKLTPADAKKRLLWAFRCGYINEQDRDYMLYEDRAKTKERAYPQYPSFLVHDVENPDPDNYLAPPQKGKDLSKCDLPAKYTMVISCTPGCYVPEEKVLFNEGYMPIKKAADLGVNTIIGLDSKSTLDNLNFNKYSIGSYSASILDTEEKIIKFKMASGGELNVTTNHPMLLSTGMVVEAANVKKGDYLLKIDGSLDQIVNIEEYKYFGKVYNVRPNTNDIAANIIVAQGYLLGSLWYQNDGADLLNRVLFRKNLELKLEQ